MREEKRGCRERRSNFSLRSTEIEWLSSDGPRFKVGVLGEGYAWIPLLRFLAKGSGSLKLRVQEVFAELPRVVAHASRGRVFSYSSYFMLKGHSIAIGFSPNRRAGSKAVWILLLTINRPVSWSILVPSIFISGLVMGPGV